MWNIWAELFNLCGRLQSYRRIPRLTIKFLESGKIKWANDTLRLGYIVGQFCHEDIGQLLLLLAGLVKNVDKPTLILPESYFRTWSARDQAEEMMTDIEKLMTGYWEDKDYDDWFWDCRHRIRRTEYYEVRK